MERLQARLEANEHRLRRAHADLEDFALRVSHDLREPLRTIASYSQLLIARRSAPADEESELFGRYITDAVARSQSLLEAMVEFVGAQPERLSAVRVDMSAALLDATRRLKPAATVTITHDALPDVVGDFDLLSKVLQHLLENAVKFAERPDPRIHVSGRSDGAENVVSVRDNGPGIDPAYFEKIFGMFRRLHGRDVPGHGLGLAFSRRAIEWQGGRIWVESAPGEGATFLFSLPAGD